MKKRFAVVVFMCCTIAWLSLSLSVIGSDNEHYRYLQRIDSEHADVDWLLEKGERTRLVYRKNSPQNSELSVTTIDKGYATVSWELSVPDEHTEVKAVRRGNAIHLVGTVNGRPVDKLFKIDSAPWFQAMSVCLRAMVFSNASKMEFWILRPDTLKPHKLIAEKQGVDTMPVLGKPAEVQQITIGLPGMLAPFWSATYWFKKEDGVFVKYEGPHGPPGSPMVMVNLVGVM